MKQAREEASRLSAELAAEKVSREKAEQSVEAFLREAKKLQTMLSGQDDELKIVHAQLSSNEISCVQMGREHGLLLVEVQAIIEERDDDVRAKADLEDDWDVALEEARYATAVWVRDATAEENASLRTTFSFFDDMLPSLDDVAQVDSQHVHPLTVAAQSMNRPLDEGVSGELSVPLQGADEEQVDFGSE